MDRDTTDRLAGAIASAVSREINNHFSTPTGRSTSNTLYQPMGGHQLQVRVLVLVDVASETIVEEQEVNAQ